ncbi:MAG: GNAT family N-acetyltransferase [Flavobacteriales bacterium]|nr:MAG: GNAT family N-acetyltransferase [Flavobacteriales bacterium]
MISLTAITDPIKLDEYHQFRHRIYSDSRQKCFLGSRTGFDKDAYDDRAMHYGWYVNGSLSGCIRFIEPNESAHPVPMVALAPDTLVLTAVNRYITERRSRNERMVEASRFCLSPEHRGSRTAREFVLAMLRAVHPFGIEHGLFDCDEKHAPFYRALGFDLLAGAERWQVPFLDYPSVALHYDFRRMIASHPSLLAGQRVPQQVSQDGGKKAA